MTLPVANTLHRVEFPGTGTNTRFTCPLLALDSLGSSVSISGENSRDLTKDVDYRIETLIPGVLFVVVLTLPLAMDETLVVTASPSRAQPYDIGAYGLYNGCEVERAIDHVGAIVGNVENSAHTIRLTPGKIEPQNFDATQAAGFRDAINALRGGQFGPEPMGGIQARGTATGAVR